MNDVVIQVVTLLYQSLHQVVDFTIILERYRRHTPAAGPRSDLIVDWIEVRPIRRPLQRLDEIRRFTTQHLNSFTGTVGNIGRA